MMFKKLNLFIMLAASLGAISVSQATVIDFTGGNVHLSDGSTATTNNIDNYSNVTYYEEDGFRFSFIGGYGTVGNYYGAFPRPDGSTLHNDVVHAHWDSLSSMVITAVDGSAFDLNYIDLTSNTVFGGGAADGTEQSFITTNDGYSMKLPSSDWGFDYTSGGQPGDGVARLWFDSQFDHVLSATFTSTNAYCFGMDNFYINEAAPPPNPVPEPATVFLLGSGITGLIGLRRRKQKQ